MGAGAFFLLLIFPLLFEARIERALLRSLCGNPSFDENKKSIRINQPAPSSPGWRACSAWHSHDLPRPHYRPTALRKICPVKNR
jgi:hypothetical protein